MEVNVESFEAEVVERSAKEPVVVDFWAGWCQPCLQLGPLLEETLAERGVTLAKVDVDANQALAQRFGVSGIPAVKAFRHGGVVAEFVGVRSRGAIEAFLDELTRPPVADSLDDREVVAALRRDDYETAFEILVGRAAEPAARDEAQRVMVALFAELGQDHPLATRYRRRLAALLF
jgi:putative thioredoxin